MSSSGSSFGNYFFGSMLLVAAVVTVIGAVRSCGKEPTPKTVLSYSSRVELLEERVRSLIGRVERLEALRESEVDARVNALEESVRKAEKTIETPR